MSTDPTDDIRDALAEALRRIQERNPATRGTINGATLDLCTELSRDEAAELLFGLPAPRGMRFQWIEMPGAGEGA